MKKLKKLISILLAFVMVITMCPTSAKAVSGRTTGTSAVVRYTVLILDSSGSMRGTPARVQREAGVRFCEAISNAEGTNYVAIVNLDSTSYVAQEFTTDFATLKNVVERTPENGGTNIGQALSVADGLLDGVTDTNVIKNIVLCSDGLPEHGEYSYSGHYTDLGYSNSFSRYGNVAYDIAMEIKQKPITIYTLGFFHSLSGSNLEFGKLFMKDIASSENEYNLVTDPNDLEFTFGSIAETILVKNGEFKYPGSFMENKDSTANYCYTDGYFATDGSIYNSHLATMSLCFELSTWSSYEGTNWTKDVNNASPKFKNARDLLIGDINDDEDEGLGFERFAVNDFWEARPGKDTIGAVAASKTLSDGSTLIALGVRGGGYEQEWASNFTIGLDGDHDGFKTAAVNVLDFLNDYINKNEITGRIKLWITGYSRAGATANMAAAEILKAYYGYASEYTGTLIAPKDLYAYTFEAPQGANTSTARNSIYKPIHNIINYNDLVPMVAPSAWGFSRYNKDDLTISRSMASNYSDVYSKMLGIFYTFDGTQRGVEGKKYNVTDTVEQFKLKVNWSKILPGGDPFIEKVSYKIPTNEAIKTAVDVLANDLIESRYNYYCDYQAGVRTILSLIYGGSLADLADDGLTIGEFCKRFCEQLTFDRFKEIISPIFAFNLNSLEKRLDKVKDNLKQFVKGVLADSDLFGTIAFVADLPDVLADLIWNILKSALVDVVENQAGSIQSIYNVVLLGISGSLIQPHYPEVTLAWMMAMDTNYGLGGTPLKTAGAHHVIHINCPVDVFLYDNAGNLVAAIENNTAAEIEESGITAYVNLDDEKILLVPVTESYNMELKATGEGSVNVSINEYSDEKEANTRIVNFYNIPVSTDDVLKASLPAFTDNEIQDAIEKGSSVPYSIIDNDNNIIAPDDDIAGAEAENAKYTVSVSSNNECGYVYGGGTYTKGNFASVSASPVNGSTFTGWYDNRGNLLSTEEEYRFAVTESIELTGAFSEVELYRFKSVNGINEAESTVEFTASEGTEIGLSAKTEEGYTFTGWTTDNGTIADASAQDTTFIMPAGDATVRANYTRNATEEQIPGETPAYTDIVILPFTPEEEPDDVQEDQTLNIEEEIVPASAPILSAEKIYGTSVKLTWTADDTALSYRVKMLTDGKWKTVKTTKNTSLTIKGLSSITPYTFKLEARRATDNGKKKYYAYGEELNVTTRPIKVKNFKAAVVTSDSVKLTWGRNTDAAGYELCIRKNGKWVKLSKKTAKNLESKKTYKFRVRSYNVVNGEKVYSVSSYRNITTE